MNDQTIYAITREGVEQVQALLRLDGAERAGLNARAAAPAPGPRRAGPGTIAVIPVYGLIEQKQTFLGALLGGTPIDALSRTFRQSVADPSVEAIVFDVSSGGGSVFGVTDFANQVLAARGSKPIVAVVNSMACSAAYWIASAADEIVSTPDGVSGSIGVFAIHTDVSKAEERAGIKQEIIAAGDHKADAVPGAPLSDAGRKSMQALVDHMYALMVGDIARGRRVSPAKVKADFGKGLTMTAPAAKAAGLVDRVGTLDETLGRLATQAGRDAVASGWGLSAASGEAARRIQAARHGVASHGSSEAEVRLRRARLGVAGYVS